MVAIMTINLIEIVKTLLAIQIHRQSNIERNNEAFIFYRRRLLFETFSRRCYKPTNTITLEFYICYANNICIKYICTLVGVKCTCMYVISIFSDAEFMI